MIASMQGAAKQAAIDAASAFGFGGLRWTVQRPSGTGTGTRTLTTVADVTLLAFRQQPGSIAPDMAGAPVLADVWRYILLAGTLKPGDVIISRESAAYTFGIASSEPWYDYRRGDLERRR